ncbi:hypothetical protein BFR06_30395 [Burkholderia pseudomallei]|nr:hypothetical protein AM256_30325 [Burkholderia pseudomallei]ALC03838.1 hypothetical protein AM257_30365 [Burkholderia pseudomallei]ANW52808.1 hypothetical protein A7U58_22075 [Burkholderia pseudomallei]APF96016.1 hypothetical protein BFR05_30375 [Burkholderia pseudomallei]APG02059.1 hypothetical protein BFR06_30395 [Burkholderia pseudomallei]
MHAPARTQRSAGWGLPARAHESMRAARRHPGTTRKRRPLRPAAGARAAAHTCAASLLERREGR